MLDTYKGYNTGGSYPKCMNTLVFNENLEIFHDGYHR